VDSKAFSASFSDSLEFTLRRKYPEESVKYLMVAVEGSAVNSSEL